MLFEGTVEGTERIEARVLADVDYRIVSLSQKPRGIGYAQGVYVIVESDVQLITEEVGYVVLRYV